MTLFWFNPPLVSRTNRAVVEPTLPEIQDFVRHALAEDMGSGDVTTAAVVPPTAVASAAMMAREPLILAGIALAVTAFRELSPDVIMDHIVTDGSRVEAGQPVLRLRGPARALLTAERVALNCVQRLSGVATLTSRYVKAAARAGTATRILDTRKTTPGWRRFEKYAVGCGGGVNHRRGLDDLVLIKDNHLAAIRDAHPNPIAAAIQRARDRFPHLKVEVEADTLAQVRQAIDAQADIVLLDNMSIEDLTEAVALCRGRAVTEASGGVRLDTVTAIAATGVDYISVGALTHSARAVDIGLDFEA